MKIDAINFGAFTGAQPQPAIVEETGTSGDEFDDTRIAKHQQTPINNEQKISNPMERKNGTIEDLMSMQASTEKMAHSYGYNGVEHATEATSNTNAVSGVSGMNLNA
jgi:hypothetical protein